MDKTMVKRLATQCGVVDNFEIGSDTARQEQLDMDCLTKFAHACCAWQREQDALHENAEQLVLEAIVAELEQYHSLYMHTAQDGEVTLDGTVYLDGVAKAVVDRLRAERH